MKRRRRHLLIAIGSLALLAAGVALAVLDSSRDEATRVAREDAAELVGARPVAEPLEPGLRPAPGTYEYVGEGRERLSLLGGDSHEFPDRVTAVVELDPDDDCAWTLSLVLVEEHVERRSYCTTSRGVRDTGFARTTTFLGREQTSSYECDEQAHRLPPVRGPRRWTFTCVESRGGTVRFASTRVGQEQLQVAGDRVATTHVRTVARQRDKSTGDERADWWLLDSGLPVAIDSTRSLTTTAGPLGRMTTTERIDYRLSSLDPEPIDAH